MDEYTTDPEPALKKSTDADERMLLQAERVWEGHRIDPLQTEESLSELEKQSADERSRAILRILRLLDRQARGDNEGIIEESAELASLVADIPLWLARLESIAGSALQTAGDYAEALASHRRALAIREEIADEIGIAASLAGIGNVHHSLGTYAEALEYNHRALAINESIANQRGIANALNNIGYLHFSLGEYPAALEYHLRALAIREQSGDITGIGTSSNNIGLVYDLQGEFGAALEFYRRSLAICEEIGNRLGAAIALENIGSIHYQLGEYPSALDYYSRSLSAREKIGDRAGIASCLGNISNVHSALDDRRSALDHARRALVIREEIGDRAGIALMLGNIGNDHAALGEYAEALEYQQRSLVIREEIGDRAGIALTLGNIGNIFHQLGEYPQALEHFRRAYEIWEQTGTPYGLAASMSGIGHALVVTGDIDEGIAMLHSAVAEATRIDAREIILRAHERLVRAHEQRGDYAAALASLREHGRINDLIQRDETRQQLQQLEARKQIEIEQLRNVELRQALEQIEAAHAALKATQVQLVHAEKMSSLGQLTAGIAHEINNPINYISSSIPSLARDIGFLEELIESVPDEDQRSEGAEVIEEMRMLVESAREGARRVSEIVRSLRSFSRLDEDEIKLVSLHEGIDSALSLLGSKLDGRITITRDYGAIPAVECRPGQINQVFMHLLCNAIDAIAGAGEITITTTSADDHVNVTVADSGIGIAPENLERVFEPFYTTKDVGKGQGLGLAISYGIVRSHGGEISVESMERNGSKFGVRLPAGSQEAGGKVQEVRSIP